MKKINELYPLQFDTDVKDIKINSKEVGPGDIFVCIKGIEKDRHDYIDEAIKNGAVFLIVKKESDYKVPFIKVKNPNKELATLSKNLYDNPQKALKLIGVTGTDGKTSTTTIIRQLLGIDKCGYIGTNGIEGLNTKEKENNTTPECHVIYKYLDIFKKEGLKYVSMETSSEAFYRKRLDSFKFDVGILTNVTEDHINIHGTLENYLESKSKLFRQLKKNGTAILNYDDKYFDYFRNCCKGKVLTYGKNDNCTINIFEIEEHEKETLIKFKYEGKNYSITSPLIGEFNVYNLMAAILALVSLKIDINEVISNMKNINPPKGRCEYLDFGQDYKIVLDYAHTPNGLKSILEHLNKIKKGEIITVTGSAGGRETEKRKDMGNIVLTKSDLVIFTMDDPRFEDPKEIIKEMIGHNTGNYQIIIDREKAIKEAFNIACKDDIILIAGKGRDNYMAIEDRYEEYNDYDVVEKYFNK